MSAYSAPVTDMLYVLGELLDVEGVLPDLSGNADISLQLMREVLREASRFCSEIVHPLNRLGDQEGCTLENGVVRTPKGFPEAYAAFVASGWAGLSHDANHGGQGLPRALQVLFDEMLSSANFSFGLVTSLTSAAVKAIAAHGSAELQAAYLPRMVSGEWTGAMALTETHAGTDLGLLRSKAEAAADGSYRVTGTKMFITAGDHDMAENIIHLVLARLPDAPPGIKGISLFLIPKYLPGKDAPVALRNGMTVGSIEHKMGIKASPTCVMNYDGATGWLVGQPHRGLQAMFTMMNAERLFVGIQGLGIAEASYQGASAYARERLQGRGPGVADGPPASILVHPDVRRMLLTIRAFTEGGRALAVWLALEMDKAALHPDASERAAADGLAALLTPVVKAAFTDMGFESAVLGQQVLGGHGYICEWGMEQLVRDARIAQIYEGTNGVQALDLVGRKLVLEDGALPGRFFALVRATIADGAAIPGATEFTVPLAAALDRLEATTVRLVSRMQRDPAEAGAASTDYLRFMALVALGWMWTRMALLALTRGAAMEDHHRSKLSVARFFMARLLPQSLALDASVAAGAASLMAMTQDEF
jgi:alkylation response protein AidB-like acyl-CoA dehydrogenase